MTRGNLFLAGVLLAGLARADIASENKALRLPQGEKREIELLVDAEMSPGPVVVVGSRIFFSESRETGRCRGRGLVYFERGSRELTRVGGPDSFNCVVSLRTDGRWVYVVSESERGHARIHRISAQKPVVLPLGQDEFAQRVADMWFRTDGAAEAAQFHPGRQAAWSVGTEGALLFLRFLGDKGPKLLGGRWLLEPNRFEGTFVVDATLPADVQDPATLSAARILKKLEMTEVVEAGGSTFSLLSDPSEEGELLGMVLGFSAKSGQVTQRLGALSPTVPGEVWPDLSEKDWWIRRPRYLTPTAGGFVVADRTDYAQEHKIISYYSLQDKKHYWVNGPATDVGGLFFVDDGLVISQPKARRMIWSGPKDKKTTHLEEKS